MCISFIFFYFYSYGPLGSFFIFLLFLANFNCLKGKYVMPSPCINFYGFFVLGLHLPLVCLRFFVKINLCVLCWCNVVLLFYFIFLLFFFGKYSYFLWGFLRNYIFVFNIMPVLPPFCYFAIFFFFFWLLALFEIKYCIKNCQLKWFIHIHEVIKIVGKGFNNIF